MNKHFSLEDVTAYRISLNLSDRVYQIVSIWLWFDKKTVGSQWVDATDSIAANIAEGFGRYHKKDKIKFYYNSRGSVLESGHWLETAKRRKLIKDDDYIYCRSSIDNLPKEINNLIRLTDMNLRK